MPTLTDDDTLTATYRADLHAMCQQLRRRRLECSWAPSGYCRNCGRPIPSITTTDPTGSTEP